MKIKEILKCYFTMTRSQQVGTITLLCLIFLAVTLPNIVFYWKEQHQTPNYALMEEIKQKIVPIVVAERLMPPSDTIFFFNPNKATIDDFLLLGIPENAANNIVKYRNAGGVFKKPDDLAKIHGLPDSVFLRLKVFIDIPQEVKKQSIVKQQNNKSKSTNEDKTEVSKVDKPVKYAQPTKININTADSAQLVALRGIGAILAKRIITYRDNLGGFYSIEQLREVRNLPYDTYINICEYIYVDTTKIKKLNINNFRYNQLSKHPYITIAQINSILENRKIRGKFNKPSELVKYNIMDSVAYKRIEPYIEAK